MMQNMKCHYCGNEQIEERQIRYIYSREGKELYVPDMPVDVCLACGMIYYHGASLLKVERKFKAIYQENEEPDHYTTMPVMEIA